MNILIAIVMTAILISTVLILAACRLSTLVERDEGMRDLSHKQNRMLAGTPDWRWETTTTFAPDVVETPSYFIISEESQRFRN